MIKPINPMDMDESVKKKIEEASWAYANPIASKIDDDVECGALRHQLREAFKAGYALAMKDNEHLVNEGIELMHTQVDQMIKLQSENARLKETLLRIQVRIDETNHHEDDLKAISKITKEALEQIILGESAREKLSQDKKK